ncbi:MAG: HIT family protein [Thermoplasmata archaeon]|nr:HIT family protein [Thermoplasmata archaeon]
MTASEPSSTCIFCGIVERRLPGHIVYEDERTLAFLDLFPWTRGHLLIVPKPHVDRLRDLPKESHAPYLAAIAEVCRRVERLAPDYNVAMNQGSKAGQIVFHLHAHVIPRYGEENPFAVPHRQRLDEADARRLVEILRPPIPP